MNKETDTWTDRQTDRHRQTDGQTDRQDHMQRQNATGLLHFKANIYLQVYKGGEKNKRDQERRKKGAYATS